MARGTVVARASGLSHRYKDTVALSNVDLCLYAGEIVGLIGPDGVGKSTLIGLIAGAKKMQAGDIEIFNGDMRRASHRRNISPRISYMPQGLGKNLFKELSIKDNLDFFGTLFNFPQEQRAGRIEILLRATGLSNFADRPAGKLSGGMKQKLGLCCALMHDPDLLILDEPTTGVDPVSRQQFWSLISTLRKTRPHLSILVSTAYMDEAADFDRIIAMNNGQILTDGDPAAILSRTGASSLEDAFIRLMDEDAAADRPVLPPLNTENSITAIRATNLTKKFGDFTAVNSVTFDIKTGEVFGFLGSNGCGKTTTMKVLTGLLPASEGSAQLFGRDVDAANIESRRDIGYMSQLFSLYSELTVEQNLFLHARLFHLTEEETPRRVEELINSLDLATHRKALTSSLPLGIRQRLSLAVAIIHKPKILILDEPTSGVDPVARDQFWRILIDLSRQQGVTIFISTHFMNEAERCDRVSLMHAGKVLVSDTPQAIIAETGEDNFEDAAVTYISKAMAPSEAAPEDLASFGKMENGVQGQTKASFVRFNPDRLLAYAYKETRELMKDHVRLAFSFFGSLLLLLVLTYGVSGDVSNLRFSTYDLDQTPHSRAYVQSLAGSAYFIHTGEVTHYDTLEDQLLAGEIELSLEIPPGFGKKLKDQHAAEIFALIDGADTSRASTIENYLEGAHANFIALNSPASDSVLTVEPRFRYNPALDSLIARGPVMPGLLLILFPALLSAISIVREKEIGTITNFYVTPATRLEFLLGKQVPYIFISMINFLLLVLTVIFVIGVPFKGNFTLLAVASLVYVLATTSFGMIASAFTRSQVAAVFVTAIVSMLPTLQFSGLIQPTATLEGAAKVIGQAWPTTYYNLISSGTYLKGMGWSELYGDILRLGAFYPIFLAGACFLLNKQEK